MDLCTVFDKCLFLDIGFLIKIQSTELHYYRTLILVQYFIRYTKLAFQYLFLQNCNDGKHSNTFFLKEIIIVELCYCYNK